MKPNNERQAETAADSSAQDEAMLSVRRHNTNALVGSSLSVWEALYNPMTWESSYGTLSVHLSKEGAEKAIAFHKMEKIKEWQEMYPEKSEQPYEFGAFEDWAVREVRVLP